MPRPAASYLKVCLVLLSHGGILLAFTLPQALGRGGPRHLAEEPLAGVEPATPRHCCHLVTRIQMQYKELGTY